MVKLQGHCETPLIMRVLVGLLCVAAAAKPVDDTTIRKAVTLWLSDRGAAEAAYGHISITMRTFLTEDGMAL